MKDTVNNTDNLTSKTQTDTLVSSNKTNNSVSKEKTENLVSKTKTDTLVSKNKTDSFVSKNRNDNFVAKKTFSEFEEKIISINRITKVVKGGRRLRFSALVVVGDKKGRIGFANAKAQEVLDAIKKALEKAKKNLFQISLSGSTIPHEIIGKFGASKALLKPAAKGTGIIAGGKAARVVFELVGINDILAKSFGSRTSINILRAIMDGLQSLRTIKEVEKIRGISLTSRFVRKRK